MFLQEWFIQSPSSLKPHGKIKQYIIPFLFVSRLACDGTKTGHNGAFCFLDCFLESPGQCVTQMMSAG